MDFTTLRQALDSMTPAEAHSLRAVMAKAGRYAAKPLRHWPVSFVAAEALAFGAAGLAAIDSFVFMGRGLQRGVQQLSAGHRQAAWDELKRHSRSAVQCLAVAVSVCALSLLGLLCLGRVLQALALHSAGSSGGGDAPDAASDPQRCGEPLADGDLVDGSFIANQAMLCDPALADKKLRRLYSDDGLQVQIAAYRAQRPSRHLVKALTHTVAVSQAQLLRAAQALTEQPEQHTDRPAKEEALAAVAEACSSHNTLLAVLQRYQEAKRKDLSRAKGALVHDIAHMHEALNDGAALVDQCQRALPQLRQALDGDEEVAESWPTACAALQGAVALAEGQSDVDGDLSLLINSFMLSSASERCAHVQYYHRSHVEARLLDIFPERLVSDALSFYGMERQAYLDVDAVQALVVGALANITAADLEHLWEHNRSFVAELTAASPLNAYCAQPYESLTEEQRARFLLLLRHPKGLTALAKDKKAPYSRQLTKDRAFLRMARAVERWQPAPAVDSVNANTAPHRLYEYLSKQVIYGLCKAGTHFSDGVLLSVYDEGRGDALQLRQMHQVYGAKGLYAVNVLPVIADDADAPLQGITVFRGTNTRETASVVRDLLPSEHNWTKGGPGRRSFSRCQQQLLDAVTDHARRLQALRPAKPITWGVTGHSLGGCDAMRAMALLTQHYDAVFDGCALEALQLADFNSPKVEKDIAAAFLRAAAAHPAVAFVLDHLGTQWDPVQRTGDVALGYSDGADDAYPDNVFTTHVVFDFRDPPPLASPQYHQRCFLATHYSRKAQAEASQAYIREVYSNDPAWVGVGYGVAGERQIAAIDDSQWQSLQESLANEGFWDSIKKFRLSGLPFFPAKAMAAV